MTSATPTSSPCPCCGRAVTAKEPAAKRAKTDAPQILPIGRLTTPRPDMGAFQPFARLGSTFHTFRLDALPLEAKSQGQSHAQTTIDSACALPSILLLWPRVALRVKDIDFCRRPENRPRSRALLHIGGVVGWWGGAC